MSLHELMGQMESHLLALSVVDQGLNQTPRRTSLNIQRVWKLILWFSCLLYMCLSSGLGRLLNLWCNVANWWHVPADSGMSIFAHLKERSIKRFLMLNFKMNIQGLCMDDVFYWTAQIYLISFFQKIHLKIVILK